MMNQLECIHSIGSPDEQQGALNFDGSYSACSGSGCTLPPPTPSKKKRKRKKKDQVHSLGIRLEPVWSLEAH